MKLQCWTRIQMTAVAALCVLMLGMAHGAWAQETKEKVTIGDVDRTYMVRLPQGYDAKQKYPVVILLHGMNQDTDDMERLTRFANLADKDGIIAVYPKALHGRWNVGVRPPQRQQQTMGPGRGRRGGGGYPGGGGGYPGGGGGYPGGGGGGGGGYPRGGDTGGQDHEQSRTEQADDVDFLNQMLDQMALKFSVDAARVYATGLSEGGLMAMKVGCSMADRIAGIAPVGAAMPKSMICLPSRPLPVVMINGTSDPVVPYGGGTEHNMQLPVVSVEDSAKAWARIDRCSEKPTQSKLPAHEKGSMEVKVDTFEGCHEGAQVVSYSVKGAGNTWPGGEQYEVEKQVGKTAPDPNANETIWAFLATKKVPAANAPDKSDTGKSPDAK
jgi:polyhydroxybutyrate depolymerase